MNQMTRFLLDSGDTKEYREIAHLAKENGQELWGATTNPTLIAQNLGSQKLTQDEAFKLQKDIVLEITEIVPGAVSAEVYADEHTPAEAMIEQGKEIATWHRRVIVKIPTTLEGFKTRTELRKAHIPTNNTLVFSQEQIFAICLHEHIMQKTYGPLDDVWPPFISPFVGRLDDQGFDGMQLVEHGMKLPKLFQTTLPKTTLAIWMLAASIRKQEHMQRSVAAKSELITAPAKVYREWFTTKEGERRADSETAYAKDLKPIPLWTPNGKLLGMETLDEFMQAIADNTLDITHPLTHVGIKRFAQDWKAILKS